MGLLLVALIYPNLLWPRDTAQVKRGVVKITAQVEY